MQNLNSLSLKLIEEFDVRDGQMNDIQLCYIPDSPMRPNGLDQPVQFKLRP